MNKLFMILILFLIDPGAGDEDTHLLVQAWLDKGKPCPDVDDGIWTLQDEIIRAGLNNKSFSAYHHDYWTCDCKETKSPCYRNHSTNYTQLTYLYKLVRPSTNLNILKPSISIHTSFFVPQNNQPTYFLCAVVTPTSAEHKECQPPSVNQQNKAKAQESTPSSSGPNIGTIVGASLAGLIALAGLALAYPAYRHLKSRNQVDAEKDMSPIIPTDFGITDAPNSVAPAGT